MFQYCPQEYEYTHFRGGDESLRIMHKPTGLTVEIQAKYIGFRLRQELLEELIEKVKSNANVGKLP